MLIWTRSSLFSTFHHQTEETFTKIEVQIASVLKEAVTADTIEAVKKKERKTTSSGCRWNRWGRTSHYRHIWRWLVNEKVSALLLWQVGRGRDDRRAHDCPWIKITKIIIIIIFALISSLVFAREAFGSVKTSNFGSKNSERIENFMSWHGRELN